MVDSIVLDFGKSIRGHSQNWYRKLQHLGTGGNAVVFLVLATSGPNQGSLFALKMFRRLSITARRERFMREIEFLVGCNHASITPVYDYGIFSRGRDEFPFLITEYQPVTLSDIIKSGGAAKIQKISYILQILSALNYLSTLTPAVVHRDLKPQNIFINGPSCMLGDFGLIKTISSGEEEDRKLIVESRDVAMPFAYRTPDLISYSKGESQITPKSDIFQLGLTAAELFTGRNPQQKANNLLDPLVMEPVGYIRGIYGRHLQSLIQRMLVLNPEERENAGQLINVWQGVFENVANETDRLEGHVFSKN
jgi:serine/threonine protein kinase